MLPATPSLGSPGGLLLRPGNAQWIGTRAEQQDDFGFDGLAASGGTCTGPVLVVLADGMGGLQAGRTASRLAVQTFRATYAAQVGELTSVPCDHERDADHLDQALQAANRAVHDFARSTLGAGEVGTTLVAALVCCDQLFWVSVGDSRLYLYRGADGSLTSCTDDHNLANALRLAVDAGTLAPEAAATHPDREALTSFLGLAEIPEVDRNRRPLTLWPGDRLLLCSDGVDRVLTHAELAHDLAGDPQLAADALIGALRARALEHQDNATVAILACDAPPLATPEQLAMSRRSSGILPALSALLALMLGALAWLGLGWWDQRDQRTAEIPSTALIGASLSPNEPVPLKIGTASEAAVPETSAAEHTAPPDPVSPSEHPALPEASLHPATAASSWPATEPDASSTDRPDAEGLRSRAAIPGDR